MSRGHEQDSSLFQRALKPVAIVAGVAALAGCMSDRNPHAEKPQTTQQIEQQTAEIIQATQQKTNQLAAIIMSTGEHHVASQRGTYKNTHLATTSPNVRQTFTIPVLNGTYELSVIGPKVSNGQSLTGNVKSIEIAIDDESHGRKPHLYFFNLGIDDGGNAALDAEWRNQPAFLFYSNANNPTHQLDANVLGAIADSANRALRDAAAGQPVEAPPMPLANES